MNPITAAIIASSITLPVCGAVTSYLNRGAFETAVATTWQWNFDSLAEGIQYNNLMGPDGTTRIPFTLANPTVASIYPPMATINNGCIYFNPQASRAFVFNAPVSSFGISILWGSNYNLSGVGMQLYDAEDNLITEVRSTTADSLAGPFLATWYEGFLGFESESPIASIRFDHLEGAVYFDNAAWTTVPEVGVSMLSGASGLLLTLRRSRRSTSIEADA